MNIFGINQRELQAQEDDADSLVFEMVAETASAKKAWVAQLEMMMEREADKDTRETLRQLRLDELKHIRILGGLPGSAGVIAASAQAARPENIIGYSRAAKLKLKSAEFVRRVYYNFPDTPTRDSLFEIICDDTNNAIRFALLSSERM
ncbi:MAG: hypothetical protein FWD98_07250 [Defluviitaleaceae bacterium]|nr:hypothetical protein [Defluviitaleaceae bacterium]